MTIHEMIIKLIELKTKYGSDIPVYFDCPSCRESFTPDKLVGQAIHITQEKE